MHLLDPDCLLPTALDLGERLGLGGERPQQLRGQRAVGLHVLDACGPTDAADHLHRERMGRSHLAREHCGHFVFRPSPIDSGERRVQLRLRGVQLSGCELTVGQAVQLARQEILAGGAKGFEQGFVDIPGDDSLEGCGAFKFVLNRTASPPRRRLRRFQHDTRSRQRLTVWAY